MRQELAPLAYVTSSGNITSKPDARLLQLITSLKKEGVL